MSTECEACGAVSEGVGDPLIHSPDCVYLECARLIAQRDVLMEAMQAIARKGVTTGTGRAALAHMAREAIKQAKAAAAGVSVPDGQTFSPAHTDGGK